MGLHAQLRRLPNLLPARPPPGLVRLRHLLDRHRAVLPAHPRRRHRRPHVRQRLLPQHALRGQLPRRLRHHDALPLHHLLAGLPRPGRVHGPRRRPTVHSQPRARGHLLQPQTQPRHGHRDVGDRGWWDRLHHHVRPPHAEEGLPLRPPHHGLHRLSHQPRQFPRPALRHQHPESAPQGTEAVRRLCLARSAFPRLHGQQLLLFPRLHHAVFLHPDVRAGSPRSLAELRAIHPRDGDWRVVLWAANQRLAGASSGRKFHVDHLLDACGDAVAGVDGG